MSNYEQIMTADRATIVYRGGLGWHSVQVRSLEIGLVALAQYPSAVSVRSTAKGARKARGIVYASPEFIVLEGWVDVVLPSAYGDARKVAGAVIHESHLAGNENVAAVDAAIKASGARIVRDFRGHNSYAPRFQISA